MADTLIHLIDHADELADRCERTTPHTSGHATAVAALRAASAPARPGAVTIALADGMSWPAIALVLGLTTAECRRAHGPVAPDPLDALLPDDAA